jgi:Co/Zn/Cd efflux system component
MPAHDLRLWQHAHDFGTEAQRSAERRTRWVVSLTFLTMLVELAAGWLTGSMALMADAWHMASHVGALGLAAFAYRFARQHAGDSRFTFGTGKVTALAGYTSALLLVAVAFWMVWESVAAPVPAGAHPLCRGHGRGGPGPGGQPGQRLAAGPRPRSPPSRR